MKLIRTRSRSVSDAPGTVRSNDGADISQEGKLNILGVFDAVQVPTFPSVHARAHLVVRIKGARTETGSHALAFAWKSPQGKELLASTGQLEIAAPPAGVTE